MSSKGFQRAIMHEKKKNFISYGNRCVNRQKRQLANQERNRVEAYQFAGDLAALVE